MNFLKNAFFGASKQDKSKQESSKQISKQDEQQIPIDVLTEIFQKSAKYIGESTKNVSDQNRLIIYGLYKQATVGDCNTPKPSMLDFVGKSKWTSWSNNKGMSKSNAMKSYISKVVQIDPQIQKKVQNFLQGNVQAQNKKQAKKQATNSSMQSGAALKMIEQKDYSHSYSNPYFRVIQKGLGLSQKQIQKQTLLQINNSPKCYPLHFAIDKQRVDLVKQFLEFLTIQQVQSMKDEDGTGIQEYAEIIQNQQILQLVKNKLHTK